MISRIFIYLVLAIVLPCLYVDMRYLRRKTKSLWWRRLLLWLPGVGMVVYTVALAMQRDFAPADTTVLNSYLFLVGLLVVPNFEFALCSIMGLGAKTLFRLRRNYGNPVGMVIVGIHWFVLIYGSTVGFDRLIVRHVEYANNSIPSAFDGYRIVHFSDAHVGTYSASRGYLLQRVVDSINAQHPDIVAFTGDLQNMRPTEIKEHIGTLSGIKARDGVFSVLGNHDYADYLHPSDTTREANCQEVRRLQHEMGWQLLLNDNRILRRGTDSIVVAGMENDGLSHRSPQRGDVAMTMRDVGDDAFTLMLQHDPTCWRRKILPQSNAQLTLSGHTHAAQFSIFGWSPAMFTYREWGGMYHEGSRALYVSTGIGGFVPFRFGVPAEVVVITLRKI